MDAPPGASFVVCALNEEEHIGALLDGIGAQTHRPLEVLVVDGGSRDRTREIVRERAERLAPRGVEVRLLGEEAFGEARSAANARNIGVRHARHDVVILFDADFFLVDDAFASQVVEALRGRRSVSVRVRVAQDTPVERFLAPTQPPIAAVAYRREVFAHHRFDPRLGYGEDEHFWRRAGIDVHETCEAVVGRHAPHTWGEHYAQQRWYGRTLPAFLVAMRRAFPDRFWGDTFRRHVVDRLPRALFFLLALPLALALLPLSPLAAALLAALWAALVVKNFLRDPAGRRDARTLANVAIELVVTGAGFTVGLLKGAWGLLAGGGRASRD